jgi:hypothetical protein
LAGAYYLSLGKREVERLEKIAARFEISHSVHCEFIAKLIHSLEQNIRLLESGRAKDAA